MFQVMFLNVLSLLREAPGTPVGRGISDAGRTATLPAVDVRAIP